MVTDDACHTWNAEKVIAVKVLAGRPRRPGRGHPVGGGQALGDARPDPSSRPSAACLGRDARQTVVSGIGVDRMYPCSGERGPTSRALTLSCHLFVMHLLDGATASERFRSFWGIAT